MIGVFNSLERVAIGEKERESLQVARHGYKKVKST